MGGRPEAEADAALGMISAPCSRWKTRRHRLAGIAPVIAAVRAELALGRIRKRSSERAVT